MAFAIPPPGLRALGALPGTPTARFSRRADAAPALRRNAAAGATTTTTTTRASAASPRRTFLQLAAAAAAGAALGAVSPQSAGTDQSLLPAWPTARPAAAAAATPPPEEESRVEARAARAALGGLALYAAERRFDDLRAALRAGSLSRLRPACHALVLRAPDPRKAEDAYRRLVAGVELVDSLALRASRGDRDAADKAAPSLDAVVALFDDFLDLFPALQVKPALAD